MYDLQERMDDIYAALGETRTEKLDHLHFKKTDDGTLALVTESGLSAAQLRIRLRSAVANVGMFFDCCAFRSRSGGFSLDEVKGVTANCLELRIARDLYNNDKHPPPKKGDSGLFPVLGKIQQHLRVPMGSGMGMSVGFSGVEFAPGTQSIVTADIVHAETGQVHGDLLHVLGRGVDAWEAFLVAKAIIQAKPKKAALTAEVRDLVVSDRPPANW